MISGETVISILLGVIAYFLYQIAKQLSYLTGKKLQFRIRFPKKRSHKFLHRDESRLPN